MNYLDVQCLTKAYPMPGDQKKLVFSDLSFHIAQNEKVAIVGPSGCGKSTLLQILAGLKSASTGAVYLKKAPVIDRPPAEIVYLFQQYALSVMDWWTVLENVRLGLNKNRTVKKAEGTDFCLELIRRVGLEGYAGYYPYQLSGGMQQRMAIARALAADPEVLLLDEPFSSVDAFTRASLQDLVLELLGNDKRTLVLVTHDVDEAIYMGNRVLVLSQTPAVIVRDLAIEIRFPRDQIETRGHRDFLEYRRLIHGDIAGRRTKTDGTGEAVLELRA